MIVLYTRTGSEKDHKSCLKIAEDLDKFFEEQGLAKMKKDIKKHNLYVCEKDDEILGFLICEIKNEDVAEILWMAVEKTKRNKGIGTELMEYLVDDLNKKEMKLLMVKTLAEKEDYEPYEYTRMFYKRKGFFLLETVDPYPGWTEGNPCAIYVKIL